MKTTWNQIRRAALPGPAQGAGETSSKGQAKDSPARPGADPANTGPLRGLRNKPSTSSLGLRRAISKLRLDDPAGGSAEQTVTNEVLFRAIEADFSAAKVDALAHDKLIVDPAHDADGASRQPVTAAQVRKIAAFLDAAAELEPLGSEQAPIEGLTRLQAQARRKLLNSHFTRVDLGHGVEHLRITGNPEFFAKLGIDVDPARPQNRELEILKIPADRARTFLAGKGRMMNPMTEGERTFFQFLASAMRGDRPPMIVWGSGAFFNMGGGAEPDLPEATPVGATRYANKPGPEAEVVEPPTAYEKYYVTIEHQDGSGASYAPLLSLLGEQQYTKEKIADPKFYATEITPGELTHARRPNPRRADVFPSSTENDPARGVVNNIYLIAGIAHGRGDESNGYIIDEWSSVASKFDRMNTHRGFALNADGGSSVMMGATDERGSRFKVSTDGEGRTIANVIGIGVGGAGAQAAPIPILGNVDKDELLTMVHFAVRHGVQQPLKEALAEQVANMVAFQFGVGKGGEDAVFNQAVHSAIEALHADRASLEGLYAQVWKPATRNGLAPFLDERQRAELEALLARTPERSAVEAWIGQTLSIQAERLIDGALKLSTDNTVLELTTEEMKGYYRRFTGDFRGSFTFPGTPPEE